MQIIYAPTTPLLSFLSPSFLLTTSIPSFFTCSSYFISLIYSLCYVFFSSNISIIYLIIPITIRMRHSPIGLRNFIPSILNLGRPASLDLHVFSQIRYFEYDNLLVNCSLHFHANVLTLCTLLTHP